MQKVAFSSTALVEIQGDSVLRFINREPTYAEYWVLGFDNKILIRDYRINGLRAIDYVLESNDILNFPFDFNGLALVSINGFGNNKPVVIELKDAFNHHPGFKLWIVVGLSERIPFYPYEFSLINQMRDDKYALVAVYSVEYQSVWLDAVPASSAILE